MGILDKGHGKIGLDRLAGVTNTAECGKRITQKYVEKGYCLPAIFIEGPRILPIDGVDVVIVKVPRSDRRPHAIRKALDTPLEFWARGAGTATAMDYDYLITEIDQSREARGWLNALYIDLIGVLSTAKENQQIYHQQGRMATGFTSIVAEESGSLLRVLSTDIDLIRRLFALKHDIVAANDDYRMILQGILPQAPAFAHANRETYIEAAHNEMVQHSRMIQWKANDLLEYLRDTYPTVGDLKGMEEQ